MQSTRVAVPSAWAEPIKIVDQVKPTPPLENVSLETSKPQRTMSSSAPGAQVNNLSGFAKAVRLNLCNFYRVTKKFVHM